MPVDRTIFEAVLASVGLKEQFDLRIPVAAVWGGTEEEIWIRNAEAYGWNPKWREQDGVKIPWGDVPRKAEPKPRNQKQEVVPEPPPVRDKRINLLSVNDREKLLRWTQAAIGTNPDEIHPEDIPSPAHASMLHFANENQAQFWKWIAELDAKQEADKETKKAFRDDNRRLFSVMDMILEDQERTAKQQAATSEASQAS